MRWLTRLPRGRERDINMLKHEDCDQIAGIVTIIMPIGQILVPPPGRHFLEGFARGFKLNVTAVGKTDGHVPQLSLRPLGEMGWTGGWW